ncbi:MAG: hypothetical protein F7C38_05320 [Desulfurococcales archaeon]|nr:hypothetical protein [Desulfurococcales archaeon]
MAFEIESIALKIVGWRLLALLTIGITVYSMASAYIGETLTSTINFLREEPPNPKGTAILSVYSGIASTPVTGLLPSSILGNVTRVTGVIAAWGETTTPALLNNTLVIIRGLSEEAFRWLGLEVTEGEIPNATDYTSILVGERLAGQLNLEPGDTVVVDAVFSKSQAVYKVEGIVRGPPPYTYEVITSLPVAQALRGTRGYTVIRIIYDPAHLNTDELAQALQVEQLPLGEKVLLQQAIVLLSKGLLKVTNPEKLQSYYIERLGIPSEYVFASGLVSDFLLLSLTVVLGWVLVGLRRDPLATLYVEGVPPRRLKQALVNVTLPFILAGGFVGLLATRLLPSPTLLGYPLKPDPSPLFQALHLGIVAVLYTVAIATSEIKD